MKGIEKMTNKYSIYLSKNDPETLEKLEALGFDVCICCRFHNTKWLSYFKRESNESKELHGIGNGCENECEGMCPQMCIRCSIEESLEYGDNVFIFNNVEDFVKFVNEIEICGN